MTLRQSVNAALLLPLALALPSPARALTVRPVTAAQFKQAVASHRGHVVVVNFWATWCIPCMQEFPDLVRLNDQDRARGLVVLAVSGDAPKDVPGRVTAFLTAHHADFPQYVIHGDLDTFVNGFTPQWQADFPQTFVFGPDDKLVKEMAGRQTLQSWQAVVMPLLTRGASR